MITKKKLKTKLDYELRTFGFCALLIFAFTMLFVSPRVQKVNQDNVSLESEIKREQDLNNRLMFENSEIVLENTVKNNG